VSKHEVTPGDILDNRFEIEHLVNRSGMASIFTAKDRESGDTVAIKVPHMQFESDAAFSQRFQREADVGFKLNHPNILRYYRPTEQTRPYIVTEFLRGKTLAEVLQETRPLPVPEALDIALQICGALSHMHSEGVIHRDLKPANIMLCTDGTLRIMDFGLAKGVEMRRLTFVGFTNPMGTPDYMAPEQVKGRRGDERTDLYALGAMLYEMLTGAMPFEAPDTFLLMNARLVSDPISLRKRNPQISPELEEIVLHALEREPKRRYPSAAAMKAELADPDAVRVTGRAERLVAPSLWKTRWRAMRLIVFSFLGTLLVFFTALAISRLHAH
jgi:serine/threonine protein kinase